MHNNNKKQPKKDWFDKGYSQPARGYGFPITKKYKCNKNKPKTYTKFINIRKAPAPQKII